MRPTRGAEANTDHRMLCTIVNLQVKPARLSANTRRVNLRAHKDPTKAEQLNMYLEGCIDDHMRVNLLEIEIGENLAELWGNIAVFVATNSREILENAKKLNHDFFNKKSEEIRLY